MQPHPCLTPLHKHLPGSADIAAAVARYLATYICTCHSSACPDASLLLLSLIEDCVFIAGEIVTVYRSASSTTTYDPLDIAVALNFTTRAAAGSAPPPPSSASAPTSAVSGDS